MKKGLILALMVGLGIMAGPVMAEAPVFTELPTVIIGNTEDVTTAGNTILRYLNALDLNAVVDWKNPSFTSSTHRAYWSLATDTSGIDVRVSGTSSFTDELTTAELVNLTDTASASFGAPPVASAEILGNGAGSWLSLMNLTATTTNTATSERYPPSAYGGDSLIDGWGVSDLAASVAGAINAPGTPTVVTLVAAVTSGTTKIMPSKPAFLDVYSEYGTSDTLQSNLLYHEFPVESVDGVSGWYWVPPIDDGTWITQAVKASAPTVGFSVAATDDPTALGRTYFGEWQMAANGTSDSNIYPADAASMGGKLFNARLRLSNGAAPTVDLCPSYRILYANVAFTHIGGVQVTTTHEIGAPASGQDFTAQLFWEVPANATEMADGGNIAQWPFYANLVEHPGGAGGAPYDFRDYTLLFNLMHAPGQTGDFGTLALVEVAIEAIDAPTVAASTKSYANLSTWQGSGLNAFFPTIFADGSATIGAASITLQAGTDSSLQFRFYQTNPLQVTGIQGNLADHMALADNQLVRFSYSAQSVSVATTPVVRVFLHATSSDSADITAGTSNLNFNWEDEYGDALGITKPTLYNITSVVTGLTNPCVPPAAAATLSTWIFTHDAGWGTGDYILPDFSVFSKNSYATGTAVHGWSDDSGGAILSNIQVEAFDTW